MHAELLAAPVTAFIFDMDGTMVDSMPAHKSTWIGLCPPPRCAARCRRDDAPYHRPQWRRVCACAAEPARHGRSPGLVPGCHEKEQLYREQFGPVFAEVPGFSAFYAAARAKGLRCGVGTAGDIHNLEFALGHLQLACPPDATARGDEGLSGKPTPAIFLAVAERMGVSPAHCIVFEDAPFGIEAARRAGMRAVSICTGHSAEELAGTHVLAAAPHYSALLQSHFQETLNVAPH